MGRSVVGREHDVFMSYASAQADQAFHACRTLEADGIRCWIAPRDITPGSEYPEALACAIHDARALVLLFSTDAARSGHVLREVELAVSARVPILTLRVEPVLPQGSFAYLLSTVQWLDSTNSFQDTLQNLVRAVKELLEKTPSAGGHPEARFLRFVESLNVSPEPVLEHVRILEQVSDLGGLRDVVDPTSIEEELTKLEAALQRAGIPVPSDLSEAYWRTGRLPFVSRQDVTLVRRVLEDTSFPGMRVAVCLCGRRHYSLMGLAHAFAQVGIAGFRDREAVERLTLQAINAGLLRPIKPLQFSKGSANASPSVEVTEAAQNARNLLEKWTNLSGGETLYAEEH